MKGRPRAKWVVLGIYALIGVLLVGFALIAGTVGPPSEGTIEFELRKYLIQFLLIVALGALVAFLVDEMKRRAEAREEVRRNKREADDRKQQYAIDTVKSVLERLDSTYRRVKRTRQRLGIRPGHRPDTEDDMWALRDEQEDLEQLAKDIEVYEGTVRVLEPVRPSVEAMEAYLGRCWSEYKRDPHIEEGASRFGTRLSMFVASPRSGNSDFQVFSGRYHIARGKLVELLDPVRHPLDQLLSAQTPDAGPAPQEPLSSP
jgi:hypothetical protein